MKLLKTSIVVLLFSSSCFAAGDGGIKAYVTGEGTVLKNLPPETQQLEDLNSGLMDRTNQPMVVRSLNATQKAFDNSLEKDNTRVVPYNPLSTVKIRVREFMSTLIILPVGDRIKHAKLADDTNFVFQPMGEENGLALGDELPNSGTVEVLLPGADTSLHIIGTSGNVYTFYVRGDTWDSPFSPTLKVILKDEKLSAKLDAEKRRAQAKAEIEKRKVADEIKKASMSDGTPDYLEEAAFNPANLNFGYRLKGGDESLRPFMVFDDGDFTYFRFAKESSVSGVNSFPAVYRVADGSDIPTNVTPMGSMLRVESVDNKWTLRLGDAYLCIERIEKIPNNHTSMNSVISE